MRKIGQRLVNTNRPKKQNAKSNQRDGFVLMKIRSRRKQKMVKNVKSMKKR